MRNLLLLATVLVVACISPPPQDGGGGGGDDDGGAAHDAGQTAASVPCGADTCNADEFCHDECLCCGIPGGTPASQQTCEPIPAGCSADALCDCPDLPGGGLCDGDTRTVSTMCA